MAEIDLRNKCVRLQCLNLKASGSLDVGFYVLDASSFTKQEIEQYVVLCFEF